VNEEVNVIELVPKEEQSPVEVWFDICGTDPEPEIPVDKASSDAFNPTLSFTKFTPLMFMIYCIRYQELSDILIDALPTLIT
jgi:hypothetical protein